MIDQVGVRFEADLIKRIDRLARVELTNRAQLVRKGFVKMLPMLEAAAGIQADERIERRVK